VASTCRARVSWLESSLAESSRRNEQLLQVCMCHELSGAARVTCSTVDTQISSPALGGVNMGAEVA
jgi:hypothetical protein